MQPEKKKTHGISGLPGVVKGAVTDREQQGEHTLNSTEGQEGWGARV